MSQFSEPSALITPGNVQVALSAFDSLHNSLLENAIVQSVSIGAAVSIFIIMMLQTTKKGVMYWLHLACLAFLSLRSGLYLGYLYSPLGNISFNLAGVLLEDPMPGYRYTVATNVFQVFLVTSIQISFCYQIYSMFKDPKYRKLGMLMTFGACILGLVTIAFQIYAVVRNANMIYQGLFNGVAIELAPWETNLPVVLMSVSINVMSLLLVFKLIRAIQRRRFLGIKQFSGMHILLIAFSQTFLIPTILVIVDYKNSARKSSTILYTIAITLVVLTMPLATMWAKMMNTQSTLQTSSLLFYSPSVKTESDADTFIGHDEKAMPQDIAELINDDNFQEFNRLEVTREV